MGYISITFSIIAIIIVAMMLYITTLAYNRNNKTWLDTFQYVWQSTDKVEEVISPPDPDVTYGDIGSFEGYELPDDERPWTYLSDLTKPSSDLVSFLKEDSPNRVGTSLQRL